MRTINFRIINSASDGSPALMSVPEGTLLATYIQEAFPGLRLESTFVRVNREPVKASYVINNGDVVTLSPKNVVGA